MGKTRYHYNDEAYEDETDHSYRDEYKSRKLEKRINKALRTKNVDELLEYYNEYDDEDDYRR